MTEINFVDLNGDGLPDELPTQDDLDLTRRAYVPDDEGVGFVEPDEDVA